MWGVGGVQLPQKNSPKKTPPKKLPQKNSLKKRGFPSQKVLSFIVRLAKNLERIA